MGIKSTHHVTREDAIAIINEKITELHKLSDNQLECLLEDVINNRFYNFTIDEQAEEHRLHITQHNYPSENP
jgi:hypothetical protein